MSEWWCCQADYGEHEECCPVSGKIALERQIKLLHSRLTIAEEVLTSISEEHDDSCGFHKGYNCTCATSIAREGLERMKGVK